MRITELKEYNDLLFANSDNLARVFGYVNYAPLSYFAVATDWFVREDGTIPTSGIVFKDGKGWLRAPHVIYTPSKSTTQQRDVNGISYKTTLSGQYAAHSAAVMNELHQASLLKLVMYVNTPSGGYIIGSPDAPVRLAFAFDSLNKYRLEWAQLSPFPFRGFTALPSDVINVGGLDPSLITVAATPYPSDADAILAGLAVGDYYELSMDNMYLPTGGFLKRVTEGTSSLNSYPSDYEAVAAGLISGSYYEVSASNAWLPTSGFLRRIPGGTISGLTTGINSRGLYASDIDANIAGLPAGAVYELAESNMYMADGGFLKRVRQV